MFTLCFVVQNLKDFSYYQQLLSSCIYKLYLRCSVSLEFRLIHYIDLHRLVLTEYNRCIIQDMSFNLHQICHKHKNIVVSLLN